MAFAVDLDESSLNTFTYYTGILVMKTLFMEVLVWIQRLRMMVSKSISLSSPLSHIFYHRLSLYTYLILLYTPKNQILVRLKQDSLSDLVSAIRSYEGNK